MEYLHTMVRFSNLDDSLGFTTTSRDGSKSKEWTCPKPLIKNTHAKSVLAFIKPIQNPPRVISAQGR